MLSTQVIRQLPGDQVGVFYQVVAVHTDGLGLVQQQTKDVVFSGFGLDASKGGFSTQTQL